MAKNHSKVKGSPKEVKKEEVKKEEAKAPVPPPPPVPMQAFLHNETSGPLPINVGDGLVLGRRKTVPVLTSVAQHAVVQNLQKKGLVTVLYRPLKED